MPVTAIELTDAIDALIKAHVTAAVNQMQQKPISSDAVYAKKGLQTTLSKLLDDFKKN